MVLLGPLLAHLCSERRHFGYDAGGVVMSVALGRVEHSVVLAAITTRRLAPVFELDAALSDLVALYLYPVLFC